MIKKLVLSTIAMIVMGVTVQANVLIDYDFNSLNGVATTVQPNFFGINFRRESPATVDFSGAFASSTGWATTNPSAGGNPQGDFYKFSLSNFTGSGGQNYNIQTISFDIRTVGTGAPTSISLLSDFNGLFPPVGTAIPTSTWTTVTFNANIQINHGDTRLFYLYGLGATNDDAGLQVDNVFINGQPVPEPATNMMILGGALLLFYVVRRKNSATI